MPPRPHAPRMPPGKVIELTGPRSEDMRAVAAEYSEALGRTITYVDVRGVRPSFKLT